MTAGSGAGAHGPQPPARLPVSAKALLFVVVAGVVLVLATPFVVTPSALFPFIVGKALWSRSIIEIVFAAWAVLALADPSYRPPRSWLLVVLAAGLGTSLLAAGFGASFQRSLWSSYERMQGVVDLAHWFAFAVVLASVFRRGAGWRTLLYVNLAAGAAMACVVLAVHHGAHVPFYGDLPDRGQRVGGPLGNPLFLSGYMLTNLLLALGFLARAALRAGPAPPSPKARRTPAPRGRRRQPPASRRRLVDPRWLDALLWTALAALHLWAFALAGSRGGIAGLAAGLGFAAVGYAFLARGRSRRIALTLLIVLCAPVAVAGARFFDPDRTSIAWVDSPLLQPLVTVHVQRPSVQGRLAVWEAGVKGFADRPLLGWGPDNFEAVFGRFASGYAATAEPHDQAHGKLVEVAATTGVLGLAQYLAIWSLTFLVVLRAAARLPPRDRALVLFAGAALAGHFVQSQSLFDTATGSLQAIVLLGVAVGLEGTAFPGERGPRLPAGLRAALAGVLRHRGARAAVAAAALALAGTGLAMHATLYVAADARHVSEPVRLAGLEAAIDGFEPLANLHRQLLFGGLSRDWRTLRAERGDGARAVLGRAQHHAAAALRTEPDNWRIQHAVARMYHAVAETEPHWRERARRHRERARRLAPARALFPVALTPPQPLDARPRDDGALELRWRRAEGAGYHQVGRVRADGGWRTLRYVYDPGVTSVILAGPHGGDAGAAPRYGVKACLHPGRCTAWTPWPPDAAPGRAGG